ncbi:TlpA disulfide reductase family protein [uncultured Amaricoccus sp.]|uniref:TlpA family protein disulfide reductase n=1 Tax=uncultured Amaricoccus sp. TaxID=339341 RepID=UPI00262F8B3D|nr:TlpA disulfide reductase family protein [uncultured Amaricoccus sp.]
MSIRPPVFSALTRRAAPMAALLYAAVLIGANPAAGQTLTPDQRAAVEALRTDDMRKLVVHADPIPAPDIAFTDPAGAEHRLADSNGRLRLVTFWATWCAPCREENPSLDALQRTRGGADFEVLAIATGRNDPAAIDRFNAAAGITALPPLLDPKSALARAMNVPGLPVTVILNRQGAEIARLMGGADWTSAAALAIVDYLAGVEG